MRFSVQKGGETVARKWFEALERSDLAADELKL
jgi:hypothetical protein